MPWVSAVPSAVTNLVAALNSALPGVTVADGPVVTGASRDEAVTVGFDDQASGTPAVSVTQTLDGATGHPQRQSFDIHCAVLVRSATNDTAAARSRAGDLLAKVASALETDQTLGGAVMAASCGDATWSATADQRGVLLAVTFAVSCDAFEKESS